MSKIYGYARISSRGQLDNNSLEQQEKQLRDNGATDIITEQFTGTTVKRPLFDELINNLESGDTLIVTKIDRFARSMAQGSELVKELIDKGIRINILNVGMMDNTPASKLVRNIFFAFAEFERDMIVERTQEGKAIAKTKAGFKEGRPKSYTDTQINYALDLIQQGNSYTKVAEMTQISKATLTREMRKRKARQLEDSK